MNPLAWRPSPETSEKISAAAAAGKDGLQKAWQFIRNRLRDVDFKELTALMLMIALVFFHPLYGIDVYYHDTIQNHTESVYMLTKISAVVLAYVMLMEWLVKGSWLSLRRENIIDRFTKGCRAFFGSFTFIEIAALLYIAIVWISAMLAKDRDIAFDGLYKHRNAFYLQLCYVAIFFMISRFLKMQKLLLYLYFLGGALVALLTQMHYGGLDLLGTEYAADNSFAGPVGNVDFTSYVLTVAAVLSAAVFITEQFIRFDPKGIVSLCCFMLLLATQLTIDVESGYVGLAAAFFAAVPLLINSYRRLTQMLKLLCGCGGAFVLKLLYQDVWLGKQSLTTKNYVLFAALAALIGITAVLSSRLIKWNPSPRRMLRIMLGVDGVFAAAALVAAFFAAEKPEAGALYEMGQILFHGNIDNRFGSGRIIIWRYALDLASKHIWIGIGPDHFKSVFMETYKDVIAPYYGDLNVCEAHNEYLHLMICSGIFALLSFLVFLNGLIVQCCRRAFRQPLAACCAVAVIAYAVHAFFVLALPMHTPIMWVMLGLAGAAVRMPEEEGAASVGSDRVRRWISALVNQWQRLFSADAKD